MTIPAAEIQGWDARAQRHVSVSANDVLQADHGYWIRTPTSAPKGYSIPESPEDLRAWASGTEVALTWRAQRHFLGGAPIPDNIGLSFRVYRDGKHVATVDDQTAYTENLHTPEERHEYFVTAQIDSDGNHQSLPSDRVALTAGTPLPKPPAGTFEKAVAISDGDRFARLPKTILSEGHNALVMMTAYVVRDDASGVEQVHLTRSLQAGKGGTFEKPQILNILPSGRAVSDLALAARANKVGVAWIETRLSEAPSDKLPPRIWVATSTNGGISFNKPVLVRDTDRPKKGLALGYDRYGQHHFAWGEAHKIYHLSDLREEPSNVFDARVRTPNRELVKYVVYEQPNDQKECACENCWCEEAYPLSKDEGPYSEHLEEAYVQEPALHLDDKTVTIAARQTRMWSHKPVPNPQWAVMYKNAPIYHADATKNAQTIRFAMGWKKVWKRAYEPGDEDQFAGLGMAYQYRYHGRWQPEDFIKVAQKDLRDKTGPTGTGPDHANDQPPTWRISIVDQEFDEANADRPSHPQITALADGRLLVAYEKGPSANPNVHPANPIFIAISNDGGNSWMPHDTGLMGYMPSVASTQTGEVGVAVYAPPSPGRSAEIQVARSRRPCRRPSGRTVSRGGPGFVVGRPGICA